MRRLTAGWLGVLTATALGCSSADAPSPEGNLAQAAKELAASAAVAAVTKTPPQELPRAVADETVHRFAVMDPLQMGRHSFTVRNAGAAPLQLGAHNTSCKCTLLEVEKQTLAPGESTAIHVEWRTGNQPTPLYEQTATVKTNDPQHPLIDFKVRGPVQVQLGTQPTELAFAGVTPGKAASARALIFSRTMADFRVENVRSSLPGLTWKILPADAADLKAAEAQGGRWIEVTLPGDLPSGEFQGWVRFDILDAETSAEQSAPRNYELALEGKVLRRVAVYGPAVDNFGIVTLGTHDAGKGTKTTLRMKIRDEEPELKVKQITTVPDFIQVRIAPSAGAEEKHDRYDLVVEIPRDAPPCIHLGERRGKLRVEFDHPRIEPLELQLDFAVLRP